MPTVDVEDNIKKLRESLERTTQDLFRMQGMLSTFEGFKTIDLPNDPNQSVEPTEELESTQEKPE